MNNIPPHDSSLVKDLASSAPPQGGSEMLRTDIKAYGETDMLCYRSPDNDLAAEQTRLWDPLLVWAQERWGIAMECTDGILPIAQPQASLDVLNAQVDALAEAQLMPMAILVKHLGSLITALAVLYKHMSIEDAIEVGFLEEMYQAKKWGEEEEAQEKRTAKMSECKESAKALG